MNRNQKIVCSVAQVLVAGLLAFAALPKLTAQPDAIATFETLGAEPVGRYFVGLWEAVTVLLLLVGFFKPTAAWGGVLGVLAMIGALAAHATRLGFGGNNGMMAGMAIVVLIASIVIVYLRKGELLRPFRARSKPA